MDLLRKVRPFSLFRLDHCLCLMSLEKLRQPMKIEASTVDIEERGVKVRLTVVDTPGYGDSFNGTENYKHISNYIDQQFQRYLKDESGLNRRNISDNRIHCLLYFVSSFARGSVGWKLARFQAECSLFRLKPLDLACMKELHRKVNIVPVIAKADALTTIELIQMKQTVLDNCERSSSHLHSFAVLDPATNSRSSD